MSLRLALLLISSLTLLLPLLLLPEITRPASSASPSSSATSSSSLSAQQTQPQNSNTNSNSNQNQLCQNVWKYPANCQSNCTYQLVWRYKPADDSIEFIVSSKHAQRWTGVGFSQERSLANSDVIFAWIEENSRYVMMDAYLPTYATPISDKQQSISNISATVTNGRISFRFTRKRNTGDAQEDLVFSDERCLYLIYPVEGGSVDIKNRAVITNEFVPQISEAPVCIRACNYRSPTAPAAAAAATTTAPQPVQSRPELQFPLPGRSSLRPSFSSVTSAPTSASSSTGRPPTSSTSTTTSSTTSTTTATPSTTSTTSSTTTSTTSTTTTSKPTTTSTTSTTSRPTTTTSPTSTTSKPTTSSTTTTSTTTTTTPEPPSSTTPASSETTPESQWCVGRWRHPATCRIQTSIEEAAAATSFGPLPLELSDCHYFAQWQYLEASDSVEFIIQTKTRNRWTGIGFSNTTGMANSDAIIGLIDEMSGRHFIMDTWLQNHVMPEIDRDQNIESTSGKRENGVSTLRFKRRRLTGDPADFQFTDQSCAYFFFPTHGGSFNAINKRLHKHEQVPSVSPQRICVRSCTPSAVSAAPTAAAGEVATSQQPAVEVSSSAAPTTSPPSQQPPQPTLPEKSLDSSSNISLAPSNDLSAELDSSSTAPTSASSGHENGRANPFNRLSFLSEPSLRWLAGIGCVATLLAMIVFQACFTLYKNKQAYKQNLYRQSAFKQNAYLHSAYIQEAHHQPSTGSEETQTASLHNQPATALQQQQPPPPPLNRSRPRVQPQPPLAAHHHRHPYLAQTQPQVAAPFGHHLPQRPSYEQPASTESSEPDDEEELDEEEELEELEDDMMMERTFPQPFPHQHTHAHHNHHPPAPAHQYNHERHRHLHLQGQYNQHHHHAAADHRHHQQQQHHNYHAERHRHHAHAQPPHHYRPDSYFLPSQRRY